MNKLFDRVWMVLAAMIVIFLAIDFGVWAIGL
jgi:hypothetical protein